MDEYSEEVTVFLYLNNIYETLGMVSLATFAIHNFSYVHSQTILTFK
jgi:hypothetical protein